MATALAATRLDHSEAMPMARHPHVFRRLPPGTPPVHGVRLLVFLFFTVLLWIGTVVNLTGTIRAHLEDTAAVGVTASCPGPNTRAGGSCIVALSSPVAGAVSVQVKDEGLFNGLEEGRAVSLLVKADGTATIGGWRSWANSAVLLAIAAVLTAWTWHAYRLIWNSQEDPHGMAAPQESAT